MDFTLSPSQQQVQDSARQFAQEKIQPQAAALDRQGRHPAEILAGLGELGFMGLALPEAYGGAGKDFVSYVLAVKEIAQACTSCALIMHVNHTLFAGTVNSWGTEAQKLKYLPPVAQGHKMACFALTEAEAGSDPSRLQCTAIRQGQDYILTGEKKFVTSGQVASYGLVAASTAPELGAKGISAFIVDLEDNPGVTVGPLEDKLGLRATGTVDLIFDNVRIPGTNLLGGENQGLKVMLRTLDDGRIGTAAQAVGLGRAVLTEALAYARRREQFGQAIAQFQAIQWKLADIATELESAELLTLRAAWRKDQGLPYDTGAAMAKLFATDVAMRAAVEGVQIMGGYGYLKDYPMERHLRDAKGAQIYEGTNEIMRLIIARNLFRDKI
ncbi:MAG: acyl-CoA dehydrogenase family protein [Deltaproteobacteria bacterium]|nr:acyl-CoA dehydrogenase family protein [Deltaproteobacteria bacterium]MBW2134254.1 acyl-CoA dehydrogenase family protein [Deltaproteobacteria bacterium]